MFEADNDNHPVMIMIAGDMIVIHLHHAHQALNLMGLVAQGKTFCISHKYLYGVDMYANDELSDATIAVVVDRRQRG